MPQMTDVTDKYFNSVTHFMVNRFYKMLFFVHGSYSYVNWKTTNTLFQHENRNQPFFCKIGVLKYLAKFITKHLH